MTAPRQAQLPLLLSISEGLSRGMDELLRISPLGDAIRPPSCSLAIREAVEEIERQRAENERLRNEDTKTRHALKGWVFVCPDGGDEPTHERVAAVVAEVERLRAEKDKLREEKEVLHVAVARIERAAAGAIYSQESIYVMASSALEALEDKR